jgi:hypothetical protein
MLKCAKILLINIHDNGSNRQNQDYISWHNILRTAKFTSIHYNRKEDMLQELKTETIVNTTPN